MTIRVLMVTIRKENDNITFARDKFMIYAMEQLGIKLDIFETKKSLLLHQIKLFWYCVLRNKHFDCFVVSSRRKQDLLTLKICSLLFSKPLIVDVFISTYNSLVEDRGLYSKKSLKAKLLKLFDKFVVMASDIVILDSLEHIKYFEREIYQSNFDENESLKSKSKIKSKCKNKNKNKKYYRVLIGSDSREHLVDVDNLPIKDKKCIVLYNGTYIPLHGVEYLLEAAEILQKNPKANNIEFLFYGDGQQRYEMVALSEKLGLKNVRFNFDFKEAELQKYIHKSTIYLGIFGNTDKAKRVIPCKVYKGMAMHACVLTGHSIAMDELFVEGKEYLGTKFADAKDIAEKILILANNKDLRERIAAAGYLGFLKKADISSVAKEFKEVFLDLRLMVDEKNNLNNLDKKTKQKKKIKNILRNKLGYK